jgi:hypothetical protein
MQKGHAVALDSLQDKAIAAKKACSQTLVKGYNENSFVSTLQSWVKLRFFSFFGRCTRCRLEWLG